MSLCEQCNNAKTNHSISGVLHSTLDKILSCALECVFCGYLCRLIGPEKLLQIKNEVISTSLIHSQIYLSQEKGVDLNQELHLWWRHHHRDRFGRDITFVTKKLTVCSETWHAFQRPFWCSNEPLSVEKRAPTVLEWIRDCVENHPGCVPPASSASSTHPARFVDIRGLESGEDVKLVPFADIPQGEAISYAALSHCWGGVVPLRTLKSNLQDHLHKIPNSSIPRTFANAIILAQALGISFLWIDSLCIIQDEPSDWQTEAAKMHIIYRDAVLTISATSSTCPSDGPDLSVAIPPADHIYTTSEDGKVKRIMSVRHPGLSNPIKTFENMPIHGRGWTFQERLLSRRVLHVMDDEFVWQCHARLDTESGRCPRECGTSILTETLWDPISAVYTVPQPLPGGGEHPEFATDRLWWTWVQNYTNRKLTYAADIFAAFGGIVKQFAEMSGDESVLGLWRSELPLHLSWNAMTPASGMGSEWAARVPDELRVLTESWPSWTWMSMPMPYIKPWAQSVEWSGYAPGSIVREVEVLGTDIEWVGEAWASLPSKGVLTLRGRMVSMVKTYVAPRSMVTEPSAHLLENPNLRGHITLDRRPYRFARQREKFFAMALWSHRDQSQILTGDHWSYLVLEPTRQHDGEYRRIGSAFMNYRRERAGPDFDEVGSIETITVV